MRIPIPLGNEPAILRPRPVFLASAFRPFFLLAGLHAVFALLVWLGMLSAIVTGDGDLVGPRWHGHEMLFGYASAVLAGFLLTASRVWTKRDPGSGVVVLGLVVLWLLGRGGGVYGGELWTLLDLAFLPVVALLLMRVLWAARSKRNYGFPALLLVMAFADALIHTGTPAELVVGERLGLDAILFVMVIFGGRIIPGFTGNVVGHDHLTRSAIGDRLINPAMVAVLVTDLGPLVELSAMVSILAGAVILLRMRGWGFQLVGPHPILWVLHVGYAFIGFGLILRGVTAVWPVLPVTASTHALTVGALGMMTLGMMTRVSLGHTGRKLQVARPVVLAYWLVFGAAVLRTFVDVLPSVMRSAAVHAVGGAWVLAFGIFVVVYAPILLKARADGRPG